MKFSFLYSLVAATLTVSACAGPLQSGRDSFEQAHYASAARSFEEVEVKRLDSIERAEFVLYAGLTHLALGNLERALSYLGEARETLERSPELYSIEQRSQLESAWRSLGRMPGEQLRLTPERH